MVKKEAWRIYLVLFGALVLLCGCFLVYVCSESNYGNIIEVNIEDGKCEAIEFKNLQMLPAQTCSYFLRLSTKVHGKYDLSLNFNENAGNGLDDYVRVKILVGGRTLCDIPLYELFADGDETINYRMSSALPENIEIIYYIPEEVGNEAQGAYTTFTLDITAKLFEE